MDMQGAQKHSSASAQLFPWYCERELCAAVERCVRLLAQLSEVNFVCSNSSTNAQAHSGAS